MAERTERTVLNTLIVACRDAERGLDWAAVHARDANLRTLFSDIAKERRQYAEALLPHARRLGGEAEGDGSRLASFHRAWMFIKDRMAADHDHAIVVEAERGERAALAAYSDALNGMLPPETHAVVETQYAGLRTAWNQLHAIAVAAA